MHNDLFFTFDVFKGSSWFWSFGSGVNKESVCDLSQVLLTLTLMTNS